jgi:hypothetical protein
MKKLDDKDMAILRTTFAATLVALQRGRVQLGPELQRLLKMSWDCVRDPADPPLAFEFKKKSIIQLPFGEGMQ